jgi:superfamily II DNA/RNA helicase
MLVPLLALLASGAALAQGVIYKCTPPNGSTEYTDVYRGNYCKAMDLPGLAIPAPAKRQGAPARAVPSAAAALVATPGDFPRVDGAEQRARDADRRAILEDELKNEMQKLAELRKEFNGGEPERRGDERNYAKYQERVAAMRDSISRSEKNVDALKREIANIR